MIYLRTGLPGASKTLNSLRELVLGQDSKRPFYYNNIRLLMLDMEVCRSFSGWFYGWYFHFLKDGKEKRKLIKIMKPIHDEDEFVSLDDVPWLKAVYEAHNHFDTWLYWVRRVYPSQKLSKLNSILDNMDDEALTDEYIWEAVKPLGLHFTHFENPNLWHELPKGSIILIDECQQFFPPRKAGSPVPDAIKKLETHRHGGYDLHFVTQDATLSDQNLRKLTGRHIHFHNPFGGKIIKRWESPNVFDPKDYHASKNAKKKPTAHDTNFYGVYWSAEIHTHKFQFPKILLVGVALIALIIGLFWFLYVTLFGGPSLTELSEGQVIETEQVTHTVEKTPVQEAPPQSEDDILLQYVETITQDVYINGAMTYFDGANRTFDYAFYRTTDDAVFHPHDIGLEIQPISECMANIKVGDVVKPITCNPFYIREIAEYRDDEGEDKGIRNNFDSEERSNI
ncbi:hypothetical protein VIBNIFTn2_1240006 [Vibrio nigripulchritudo FTn2]|uniref:zonular occludens toxin domain-containing protein n=1 Tax=Vibrio nigripulchritudo TaxID=28173 RepID=UPI0003B1EF8F|nr:zonular occludens toxin domain-containing protein [Vibrio nigripulchritudo]CCN40357.1 hypothetical protein VIBNIFTn2_1240006 [Vibrio nigripulchritudo FTn2]